MYLRIKIFFDHGDMLLLWCASPDGSEREVGLLLKRLSAVTNGDEAKEVNRAYFFKIS